MVHSIFAYIFNFEILTNIPFLTVELFSLMLMKDWMFILYFLQIKLYVKLYFWQNFKVEIEKSVIFLFKSSKLSRKQRKYVLWIE